MSCQSITTAVLATTNDPMECEIDYIPRTIDDHIDTIEALGFI